MIKKLAEGKSLDTGFNPIDLRKKIVDVKIEKLAVDQPLTRLNNGRIQMVKQPIVSPKPGSPRMAMNITLAGIIGLFIGLILAFFQGRQRNNEENQRCSS